MGRGHSWISLTTAQREWFEDGSRLGEGYYLLRASDLSPLLPTSYEAKVQEAVLMVAPTSSGGTYAVLNYDRVDRPAWSLDQDPFGLIVDSTGARPEALLVHHGEWHQRTIQPSTSFWDHVDESGIGRYFPHPNLPSGSSGPLSDLSGKGHLNAFEEFKRRVRSAST